MAVSKCRVVQASGEYRSARRVHSERDSFLYDVMCWWERRRHISFCVFFSVSSTIIRSRMAKTSTGFKSTLHFSLRVHRPPQTSEKSPHRERWLIRRRSILCILRLHTSSAPSFFSRLVRARCSEVFKPARGTGRRYGFCLPSWRMLGDHT